MVFKILNVSFGVDFKLVRIGYILRARLKHNNMLYTIRVIEKIHVTSEDERRFFSLVNSAKAIVRIQFSTLTDF